MNIVGGRAHRLANVAVDMVEYLWLVNRDVGLHGPGLGQMRVGKSKLG